MGAADKKTQLVNTPLPTQQQSPFQSSTSPLPVVNQVMTSWTGALVMMLGSDNLSTCIHFTTKTPQQYLTLHGQRQTGQSSIQYSAKQD